VLLTGRPRQPYRQLLCVAILNWIEERENHPWARSMASTGTSRWGRTWLAIVAAQIVLLAGATSANAQIINTLRGWDDDEPGWSGELAAAIAIAQGNTEYFEFDLSAAAQYAADRHRVRALASAARRTASGIEVAEATLLHLRHNYRLTRVVHSLVFVQAQRNPFQRIDSRFLLGLGARFDVVRAETWEASAGAAYMRDREDLTDDDTGAVGQNRASFFASVLGRLTDQILVDMYGFYQPVLNDFSDARASLGSNLDVTLVGQLTLVTGIRFAHNSRPAAGVEKDDFWLRTGLRFKF